MGLYFLFCGYFLPSSCDRHGFQGFISAKFPHLGIPLLFFYCFVLCSYGACRGRHLWFVERLLFYSLVYALFWFVVRKPMRVQSGVNVVWIVFAVIIVSAANYWVRPA